MQHEVCHELLVALALVAAAVASTSIVAAARHDRTGHDAEQDSERQQQVQFNISE
jgi:hypothetical protein